LLPGVGSRDALGMGRESRGRDTLWDRRPRKRVCLRCSRNSLLPVGTEDHPVVRLPQNTGTERG